MRRKEKSPMNPVRRTLFVAAAILAIAGCQDVRPTPGGTAGTLHAGDTPLSEIQVTVHQMEADSFQPIGFGVPDADGYFRLVTTDATGPLFLPAGEYRCTLESIGAPVEIPQEYTKAETSPLKITWTESDQQLDLGIPLPRPIR